MDERTKQECEASLTVMNDASQNFYNAAVRADNHAFIEWTGLINEYIKRCEDALANGQDFRHINKHAGKGMAVPGFALNYLNEKLGCIFGGAVMVTRTPAPQKRYQRVKNLKFKCQKCAKPWIIRTYGDATQEPGEDGATTERRAKGALSKNVETKIMQRTTEPCDLCKGKVVRIDA